MFGFVVSREFCYSKPIFQVQLEIFIAFTIKFAVDNKIRLIGLLLLVQIESVHGMLLFLFHFFFLSVQLRINAALASYGI